jgi:hypothetical protein
MKRKFYLIEGRIFADLTAIQIQDYDRETDNFWIIERPGKRDIRIGKDEQSHTYFDTWEAAWDALRHRAERNIEHQKSLVTRAQRTYDEVCKMTKPNYRPVGFR